ncbi:MAG: peptidoglycan DD-metalloendopeptidase family protein [Herpetosiphonaceae bacterium]|nr:peptidoglycan DD-metalloendopeptidase family protein [Herpetosiphonaceae bacterium]
MPVAPSRVSRHRRSTESRAAYTARAALTALAGHRAPPVPTTLEPYLPIAPLVQNVRDRVRSTRRLSGHVVVLLLACIVGLGGGFPLRDTVAAPAPLAVSNVEYGDDDFQRVVIPMSATQVNHIGGLEREAIVDVGPALIKPAPQRGPAYVATHLVQANETIAAIAARYAITPETLIAANNLEGVLAIGEDLRIPRISGVPHTIDDGETLNDIALRYGVVPEVIMTYPPNGLDHGQVLVAGREIFIPGASLAGISSSSVRGAINVVDQQARPAAIVRDDRTNLRQGPGTEYAKISKIDAGERLELLARHAEWVKVQTADGSVAWMAREVVIIPGTVWETLGETNDFPPPPPPPPVWVWPTWGDMTSGFGWRRFSVGRFHNGIDIANRQGTPIMAARSGTVIEAGWCGGYGYCVKISHGGGVTTEYGHMMSRPVVVEGQSVEAGGLIGYMGSTYGRGGYSTGTHLHFTVKVNGTAVNPLKYLD